MNRMILHPPTQPVRHRNNMMMTPEDYVGKSVRMNGMYVSFYEEENDFRYFACIVKDAHLENIRG